MKIIFFKNPDDGSIPVKEFLKSLPIKIRGRFDAYLLHLKGSGGDLEGVPFRKLHGYPLEEIRVKESRNLHRVIIKVHIRDKVVVLHGFTKKEGQKTPEKELKIAYERYMRLTKQALNKMP